MANYIITNNKEFFEKLGTWFYCDLKDMQLGKSIAIDTETTGLFPLVDDMFSVQIGTGKNNYLIDMQTHNNGLKFEEVIPYIQGKRLVGHNITFDLGFFYKHNFYPKDVYDTFLGSKLLYNGYPPYFRHGFGYVMERELNIEYDKSEQKNINVIQLRTKKSIQYCFNDVDRLMELCVVLHNKLEAKNMLPTFFLHCQYTRVLAYMEACGMPISTERWQEKILNDKEELFTKEKNVVKYIYDNLPEFRDMQIDIFSDDIKILPSLTSPKQMITVFDKFGINTKDKDGKTSIGKDNIKKTPHDFVDLWLEFQSFQHDTTTYGSNILDKVIDGRIYTTYNPILDTARISTRKGGINFLNFPANKKTRRCFKASEGYKMIVCDYDGQENVVGADLHHDEMMIKSIKEGLDLHCAFARMLFPEIAELDDATITKEHKDKRTFAKSPRFAFAYGGNGYTVANNLNISLARGQEIEVAFKELHAGVYKWGEEVLKKALSTGYIESAMGFKLHLDDFDRYKELESKVESYSKDFWQTYKKGKTERGKLIANREKISTGEKIDKYIVEDEDAYDLYMDSREDISKFFSKKSAYMRLCLNNPVQSTSAHQTKMALVKIFDTILENGHISDVKIVVAPHDEIVLECKDELCGQYRVILQDAMVNEGNKLLTSGLVGMGATANIGEDWYEAK